MSAKHTPGPWRAVLEVSPRPEGLAHGIRGYRVRAGNAVVAEAFPQPYLVAINEANARLIAAAPDLLATLTEVLADIERGLSGHQLRSAMFAARAALKKAVP